METHEEAGRSRVNRSGDATPLRPHLKGRRKGATMANPQRPCVELLGSCLGLIWSPKPFRAFVSGREGHCTRPRSHPAPSAGGPAGQSGPFKRLAGRTQEVAAFPRRRRPSSFLAAAALLGHAGAAGRSDPGAGRGPGRSR